MRSIFLCADGLDLKIQAFRERNDPLGRLIEPHITVVFPFKSDLSDEELIQHVEAQIESTSSFHASLCAQPTLDSEYVYFPIDIGANEILEIHERLYDGPLSRHLQARPYVPHITVGGGKSAQVKRIEDEAKALGITKTFSIKKMKIERIGNSGESKVIKTLFLQ